MTDEEIELLYDLAIDFEWIVQTVALYPHLYKFLLQNRRTSNDDLEALFNLVRKMKGESPR